MTLLSPKVQTRNRIKRNEYDYLCPKSPEFDRIGSPSSLTSLSSADYTAGGTLDPHISSKKIQRASTFTTSNQYLTDNEAEQRKILNGKLYKMKQFFDNYQDTISTLEIEVADKQQEIDKLDTLLKIKSEAEESLKEQIWNLELKNQDLQQQLNQFQFTSNKTHAEQSRLERENEALCQELENLKLMQQTNEVEIKKIQQEHDREILLLKKALTNLKQEKAVLNKQLEAKNSLFQSNQNIQQQQEQQMVVRDVKSEEESTTLKVSLENAHSMIRNLQKQIQDEVSERREVDELLREAQETIEGYRSAQSQWTQLRTPKRENATPTENLYQSQQSHFLGQSLGDELYQFFNSSTFDRLKKTAPKEEEDDDDESDEPMTLTLDARPTENTPQEEFGSLLKEPESFFYKPKKKEIIDIIDTPINTIEKNVEHKQEITRDKSHLTAVAITMAGNWVWKHKRKVIGNSISSHKHRRFVWIHPYSRTLYWSVTEPGSKGAEYKTKSAWIESFVVLDQDKTVIPSILIKTTLRGIQIQCLDMKTHFFWSNSLRYLLMNDDSKIDKKTSQWLDDIIKPALDKRGLNTRVRSLLTQSDSQ